MGAKIDDKIDYISVEFGATLKKSGFLMNNYYAINGELMYKRGIKLSKIVLKDKMILKDISLSETEWSNIKSSEKYRRLLEAQGMSKEEAEKQVQLGQDIIGVGSEIIEVLNVLF
jgi:hypothetical protein